MLSFARLTFSLVLTALVLAWSQAFGGENVPARLLLGGSLFVFLMIISHAVAGDRQRIFSLVASLYFVDLLIVPGMIHCAQGWFPFFSKSYPEDLVTQAAAGMLVFSVMLGLGYGLTAPKDTPAPTGPRFSITPTAAGLLFLLFAAAAFLGFLHHPSDFLMRRREIAQYVIAYNPVAIAEIHFTRELGVLAFAVPAIAAVRYPRSVFSLIAVLGAGVMLMVNNPLNLPRFQVFGVLIALLFIFANTRSPRFKYTFAAGFTVGILTLFPFMNMLSRGERGSKMFESVGSYYSSHGDFDGFQSMVNVVNWVNSDGVRWGHQLLSAALVFVPRPFWPDKGLPTGAVAAKWAGYPFTNISCPLPAEFYADFGIVGVLLGGLFCGWSIRKLDAAAAGAHGSIRRLVALGFAAGYASIVLRGSLIGVIAPASLGVLLPLIVLRFAEPRAAVAARPRRHPFAGFQARAE